MLDRVRDTNRARDIAEEGKQGAKAEGNEAGGGGGGGGNGVTVARLTKGLMSRYHVCWRCGARRLQLALRALCYCCK